ncbi:VOC family protein [Burkholderia sp. PAMC 28687]|uniref:VOC family protein n=1 Tax=Burkholderia sp. PAMC 28687 TaxID=1795874 RepID=UPI000AA5291D|nr:VOC family protein [Burkholderia sp. PAMC 28687]
MTSALVTQIIRISRNVVDLERSTLFYRDRLGFQLSGPAFYMERLLAAELGLGACNVKVQRLRLGNEELELVEAGPNARPYPSPSTSVDLAFQHLALRCANIDTAFKRLYREDSASARPTAISRGPDSGPAPVRLPDSSGGVTAFKFRDPDGHPLELLQSAGEGGRSEVRAGIDHTAISVTSAPSSIDFYTALLGLIVSAYQTNSGSQQGSLDDLDHPIVDVVSLQTASDASPHLELLAYRHPVASVTHPLAEATDIVSDRIVIQCSDVSRLATNLGMASRLIRAPSGELSFLFQDPDGHFFWAIE